MAVETPHQDYTNWAADWQKLRDVVAGQRALHLRATGEATGYLPKLSRQTLDEYEAYKRRATFYNATARTVEALCGAIFRRDPVLELDDGVREQLENVDLAGTPLDTFAKLLVTEVLTVGRYGVLVDVPSEGTAPEWQRPYWVGYCAEDVVNWRVVPVGSASVLTLVVLRERVDVAQDDFQSEEQIRYRVLDLDPDTGWYRVREYERPEGSAGYGLVNETYPTRTGQRMDFIPFLCFGPVVARLTVQRPPLLDLCDVNLAHWRKSVDYAHGLHFTALPTPWLADDTPPSGSEFRIGSAEAWTLSAQGQCGMLEFSGAGMAALKDAILDDEQRMARLGAELLTPEKREAESAEAKRITAASRTASLASLAATCSWGLTRLLQWHAWWNGASDEAVEAVSITLNQDFVDARMAPTELAALVQARQAGEISRRTFLENLERGELLEGRTIEEEIVEIEGELDIRAERDLLKEETQRTKQIGQLLLEQMKPEEARAEEEETPYTGAD